MTCVGPANPKTRTQRLGIGLFSPSSDGPTRRSPVVGLPKSSQIRRSDPTFNGGPTLQFVLGISGYEVDIPRALALHEYCHYATGCNSGQMLPGHALGMLCDSSHRLPRAVLPSIPFLGSYYICFTPTKLNDLEAPRRPPSRLSGVRLGGRLVFARSASNSTPRGSSWRLDRAWPSWDSQPIHRLVSPCLGQSLKLQ